MPGGVVAWSAKHGVPKQAASYALPLNDFESASTAGRLNDMPHSHGTVKIAEQIVSKFVLITTAFHSALNRDENTVIAFNLLASDGGGRDILTGRVWCVRDKVCR